MSSGLELPAERRPEELRSDNNDGRHGELDVTVLSGRGRSPPNRQGQGPGDRSEAEPVPAGVTRCHPSSKNPFRLDRSEFDSQLGIEARISPDDAVACSVLERQPARRDLTLEKGSEKTIALNEQTLYRRGDVIDADQKGKRMRARSEDRGMFG